MVPTLTAILVPSDVPLVIASIVLLYTLGVFAPSKSVIEFEGIIIFAYIIAAGTDKTDAVMKCCIRFSSANVNSRILINATITDPATVAMPAVININNSLLDNLLKKGLIRSGASTWPINIFAAAPKPTGPPILKTLWQALDIRLTINGNIPQYQRIADIHDITMMYGKTPNAKVSNKDLYSDPSFDGGKPKTKLAPSCVACWRINTPLPRISKKSITSGIFNKISAKTIWDMIP